MEEIMPGVIIMAIIIFVICMVGIKSGKKEMSKRHDASYGYLSCLGQLEHAENDIRKSTTAVAYIKFGLNYFSIDLKKVEEKYRELYSYSDLAHVFLEKQTINFVTSYYVDFETTSGIKRRIGGNLKQKDTQKIFAILQMKAHNCRFGYSKDDYSNDRFDSRFWLKEKVDPDKLKDATPAMLQESAFQELRNSMSKAANSSQMSLYSDMLKVGNDCSFNREILISSAAPVKMRVKVHNTQRYASCLGFCIYNAFYTMANNDPGIQKTKLQYEVIHYALDDEDTEPLRKVLFRLSVWYPWVKIHLSRVEKAQEKINEARHNGSAEMKLVPSFEKVEGAEVIPLNAKYNKQPLDNKNIDDLHKIADKGNKNEQYSLGYFYEIGQGVEKDYEKAVYWYTKAAEQGHAKAQCRLGECYATGKGVHQNQQFAVMWYVKAAEQGDAKAQYNLGFSHEKGIGVAKDIEKAVFWYRKAAKQGITLAQNNLDLLKNEIGREK